jgi:hypothetical protein
MCQYVGKTVDSLTTIKCLGAMNQILNPVDIYSAGKPLSYLCKILGLSPFTYTKSKSEYRLRMLTAGIIHSIVMSGLLVTCFYVAFRWDIENFDKRNFIIIIILLSDSCFLFFSFIVSYALCVTVNRCKVMKFLSLVTEGYVWLIKSSNSFIHSFIHLAVCLTTVPKPLPKRALHIVRSRAFSFRCILSFP